MDGMSLLLKIAVFLFVGSLVQIGYLLWSGSRITARRILKKRLLYISAGGRSGQNKLSLFKTRALQNSGPLDRLAFSLPRIGKLDRMLVKSGLPINVTSFVLTSLMLGGLGLFLGLRWLPGYAAGFFLCAFCLTGPFFWLRHGEKKSLAKFDEQLPETLDLLARSVRAGHALSSGFEIASKEMPEPTRGEFAATIDEINLGLSFREALENLCARVPSRDLRFFAMSVMIQKETGGNIAEILDKISSLIRDRIQFKRQVDALTAEGRFSAIILICLPFLLFSYIYIVNYNYISLLWKDHLGQIMGVAAIALMILGSFVMKKIVKVEL